MPLHRTRSLLVALAAALSVAVAAVPAAPAIAATGTGTVVGHIVTADGAPAAGIAVGLSTSFSDETNHAYFASTDASGDFTMSGVVPEYYHLYLTDRTWTSTIGSPGVLAAVDATVTAPTLTIIRPARVHGTVVSAIDGAPIAGISVNASTTVPHTPGGPTGGNDTTTAADGGFSITLPPGKITVRSGWGAWFGAVRKVSLGEGSGYDLGAIALDPAGGVAVFFRSRAGRAIDNGWQSAVVDGCRVINYQLSSCPGVGDDSMVAGLQLAPGHHTVVYEVRNPISAVVRRATREVDVRAGTSTAEAPVVVRADPIEPARVVRSTYRRGHAVTVRIPAAAYVDGARPHLRMSFRVSGHEVVPTSMRWRTEEDSTRVLRDVLVATLPKRWSSREALTVRVVVHGTADYAGQSAKATRLTRTR